MGSKKGCISIPPLHLRGKSTNRFCLFPKVRSESLSPGHTPVYLNVYDLTPMNGYMYWTGLGIFHSGVEGSDLISPPVFFGDCNLSKAMDKIINGYFSRQKGGHVHGVEYAFGAHDYSTSGVFEVEPRHCPGFKFRKSIFMGTTSLDPVQVREFMERHSANYNGDTYHLIVKNCNHFCKDICDKLTGNTIPKWVNRLARIGSLCNCVLPEALRVAAVRDDPNDQSLDSEKRRLRSAFSCMSSISIKQKHMSTSSLFIPSPLKGCPPPKDLRKPTSAPVEKEA